MSSPHGRNGGRFHKATRDYPCGWCALGLGGADCESIRRTEQAQGLHRTPGRREI